MTSEALIAGFIEDCRLRGFTTADGYGQRTKRFLRWLEERQVDATAITRSDLRNYLVYLRNDAGLKHATLSREFVCISALYEYLVEEGLIESNPIPSFRKRYLAIYKKEDTSQQRRLISIEEASVLVGTTLESRDRAILLLLFKTGIRRSELCSLDVSDIDLPNLTLTLKKTAKRSNRILYFDNECAEALQRWLTTRLRRKGSNGPALFLSNQGKRLSKQMVNRAVAQHAERCGLHDPKSSRLEDKFTPHCCRHWFVTHLIRAGMPRDFVKELRGDVRSEAIDIYNHIDKKELRESYLAHIPKLGI